MKRIIISLLENPAIKMQSDPEKEGRIDKPEKQHLYCLEHYSIRGR